jgi:hypothetical protein
VRFELEQTLPGTVDAVMAAFTDPGYLASLGKLAKVGEPEVLDQHRDGDTVLQRVRYRFTGDLSSAVTTVVDRRKLVWVDEHLYDLAHATATFRIIPEHYADRLRCSGSEWFAESGTDATTRHLEAELTVRWPVVGSLVERAIVSGFQEHLAEEARLLAAWMAGENP